MRAGAGASMIGSCHTVPVNESAAPRRGGTDPDALMFMARLVPANSWLATNNVRTRRAASQAANRRPLDRAGARARPSRRLRRRTCGLVRLGVFALGSADARAH